MAREKRENQAGAPKSADAESPRSLEGNQGEGNREADRRYREGATEFSRSGRVPGAAEEARKALEEDERSMAGLGDDEFSGLEDYEDEDYEEEEDEARREARDRSRLS